MKKASRTGPVYSKWCCQSSPIYMTFTYKNPLLFALGHFRSIDLSAYLGLMFVCIQCPYNENKKNIQVPL